MTELPALATGLSRSIERAVASFTTAAALPWPTAPQAAIFDAQGEALSASSVAAVSSLTASLQAVRAFFGGKWQPGDVAITNDPDSGAATACEVTVIVPAFRGGAPDLWVAVRAFVPDIGGWELGGYSPQAVDRWAEGARFEPAKIAAAGKARREVTDMLMLNSRTPTLTLRCIGALADAARGLADSAAQDLASPTSNDAAALTEALLAVEADRIDRAVARLAGTTATGTATAKTSFPELALDPVSVTIAAGPAGIAVSIAAPPLASRPVNLSPVAAEDIAIAAIAGALGLGSLRTGAIRRRLRVLVSSPSLAAAPLPAPVCLGRATTGHAVFAAALAALRRAGIDADSAALWHAYRAAHDDGALDPTTGKITPARAAAIRAREAEEAKA